MKNIKNFQIEKSKHFKYINMYYQNYNYYLIIDIKYNIKYINGLIHTKKAYYLQ